MIVFCARIAFSLQHRIDGLETLIPKFRIFGQLQHRIDGLETLAIRFTG